MMIKLFFWNIWLKFKFWYTLKRKGQELKYYKKWTDKKEGYNLSFKDEFEGKTINKDIWRTDTYYGMRYHPGNIIDKGIAPREFLSDGCFEFGSTTVKLKAVDIPKKINHEGTEYTIPYQVGQLDSSQYFMQTYGYFEIRAKMPSSPGMWPAFWLASIMAWPPEIDVYEIYTGKKNGFKTFATNAHWGTSKKKKMKPRNHKAFDLSKNFFIYGCDWSEKYLKFYFQDELVRVMKTPKDFIHPMHIIINTAVDVENIEGATFPNYYEVDYVRAYVKKDI